MTAFYKKLGKRIRDMRDGLDLSQEKLADLMRIKRVSLSQIENGERKLTAQEIFQLSKLFNVPSDVLLDLKQDVEVVLEKSRSSAGRKRKSNIRINVPQKNIKKFKEVLLYLLNKIGSKPNVGETVLYKLLYFIDFNFYEMYEEQLIGATYIKNHYGPTPKEFKKIVDKMEGRDLEKIETNRFQYPQRKYLPLRRPDLSLLKANEIEVIDNVLNRLSDMSATEISDYSHNDVPWLTADEGSTIEYEAVFYRTPEYSVRADDE